MKLKLDAYEQEENPQLCRRVKVIMPNGNEATMIYAQLCKEDGTLQDNVEKIESGYYKIARGN